MSGCSFLVWMIIVITIYSDCSYLVKPCFIAIFFTTWSHCACSICISRFLPTMIVLCSGKTSSYGSRASQFLELGVSEFWQLFPTHMLSLEFVLGFCHGIAKGGIVRLNLFNHVLALFRAKFACNLTIRYHVFRWDLCKCSVWESVKRTQDVCNSKESRNWISQLTRDW